MVAWHTTAFLGPVAELPPVPTAPAGWCCIGAITPEKPLGVVGRLMRALAAQRATGDGPFRPAARPAAAQMFSNARRCDATSLGCTRALLAAPGMGCGKRAARAICRWVQSPSAPAAPSTLAFLLAPRTTLPTPQSLARGSGLTSGRVAALLARLSHHYGAISRLRKCHALR